MVISYISSCDNLPDANLWSNSMAWRGDFLPKYFDQYLIFCLHCSFFCWFHFPFNKLYIQCAYAAFSSCFDLVRRTGNDMSWNGAMQEYYNIVQTIHGATHAICWERCCNECCRMWTFITLNNITASVPSSIIRTWKSKQCIQQNQCWCALEILLLINCI